MNLECHQRNIVFNVPSDASFLMKERDSAQRTVLDHSLPSCLPGSHSNSISVDDMKSSLA